jgi:hypothetical protein
VDMGKCCEHAISQLERQGVTHATHHKQFVNGTEVSARRHVASSFHNRRKTFRHFSIKIQTSVPI